MESPASVVAVHRTWAKAKSKQLHTNMHTIKSNRPQPLNPTKLSRAPVNFLASPVRRSILATLQNCSESSHKASLSMLPCLALRTSYWITAWMVMISAG